MHHTKYELRLKATKLDDNIYSFQSTIDKVPKLKHLPPRLIYKKTSLLLK